MSVKSVEHSTVINAEEVVVLIAIQKAELRLMNVGEERRIKL